MLTKKQEYFLSDIIDVLSIMEDDLSHSHTKEKSLRIWKDASYKIKSIISKIMSKNI